MIDGSKPFMKLSSGSRRCSSTRTTRSRKQIQAILSEKEGRFNEAVDLHLEISEKGEIKESAKKWHGYRSKICEAKRLAIDGEYRAAKVALSENQGQESSLLAESKDLSIVIEAAIAFQQGELTDIRIALEELTPIDQTTDDPRPLTISYNYEAALSVLTAAQRLVQVNVDQKILSMLAEVALRHSLINVETGNVASNIGLDNIDLENRWKSEIPSPVARRVAQIELDEEIPTTDYTGRATRVLGTLEIYLAMFVEYHSYHYWGSKWKTELTAEENGKKLSIGDLLDFFRTKAAEELDSSSEILQLLDETILGRNSIAQLRNELSHEYVENISEDEYYEIRNRVIDVIRTTASEVPVIGQIENAFPVGNFYAMRLYWWRPNRQILVNTSEPKETGTLYYLPRKPFIGRSDLKVVEINTNDIIPISTDRVISNILQDSR